MKKIKMVNKHIVADAEFFAENGEHYGVYISTEAQAFCIANLRTELCVGVTFESLVGVAQKAGIDKLPKKKCSRCGKKRSPEYWEKPYTCRKCLDKSVKEIEAEENANTPI